MWLGTILKLVYFVLLNILTLVSNCVQKNTLFVKCCKNIGINLSCVILNATALSQFDRDMVITCFLVAESMASKSKFTGWLYNNGHVIRSHVPSGQMITSEGHMTGANSMTAVSESMVEHMSTVTVQQGYDSMLVNSMGSD